MCVMDPLDYPDAYCSPAPATHFNGTIVRPSLQELKALEHAYTGHQVPQHGGSTMSDVLDVLSSSLPKKPVIGVLGDSFMQQEGFQCIA